jgi:Collagen triple helix repeat (20 copies)
MEKSLFAGLTILDPGEGLSTDDGAFVNADRRVIDHLLEVGAKTHRHTGLNGLASPSAPASAAIIGSGGTLAAGLGISVGYTLEDDVGGETMLSPVTTLTTLPALSEPTAAPSGVADYGGGALDVDTYYYALTFSDGEGGETPLGPAVGVERVPGFASGRVTLTQLSFGVEAAGAVGWRLYRAIGGGSFDLLTTGGVGQDEFVDDGTTSADCDVHPPQENSTAGVSTLLVSLPVAVSSAAFINLYASITGDFSGGSFLGRYPVASAGNLVAFPAFELSTASPPSVNLSIGGAHQIDPDTELLDWHWKRPVGASSTLPSGVLGDVRLSTGNGGLYAVLDASAGGPADWVRIGSAAGGAGASGAPGPAGASGAPGPAGASGAPGPKGASGAPGPAGASGAPGPAGASGAPGPPGASGAPGPAGASGAPGPAGASGAPGPAGASGAPGPAGASGAPGASGALGPATWTPIVTTGVKKLSESRFEKVSAGEGEGQMYSQEGLVRGCFLTFVPEQNNLGFGVGLNSDPTTDAGFSGIDYWINCNAAGTLFIRESGTLKLEGPAYKAGDVLTITYDGQTVRYWQNATLLREVARPIGSALFVDSWWNQATAKIKDVHFGPMGEAGASGAPGPAGASGAPGLAGASGAPGPAGASGAPGPAGASGAPGAKGEKGATGSTGAAGESPETVKLVEASVSASGTSNLSWQYSNASMGVLVLIVANDTTPSDEVSEVTIAGRKMNELPGSPFLHTAGSEDGVIYAYWLSYPGISGTVAVTVSGASTKRAVAIGFSSNGELLAACDVATLDSAGAKTFESEEFGRVMGRNFIVAALHTGADAIGTITVPADEQILQQYDFGTTTAHWIAMLEDHFNPDKIVVNSSIEEEGGLFAVAISPAIDHGVVSTMPTENLGIGDTVSYIADATNGIIWDFVYDGQGEFPWKKIGGPPLFAENTTEEKTTSTSYTTLSSPAITAPLKGDYFTEVSARYWNGGVGNYGYMSPKLGGAETQVENGFKDAGGNSIGMIGYRKKRVTGVTAGMTIQSQVKVAGGEGFFSSRWMTIDPIRVVG